MSHTDALTQQQVETALATLADWSLVDGQLAAEFDFSTFADAFGFMTTVALHAQEVNHHPDWSNSYTKVAIRLKSHDVDAISERDLALARKISAAASRRRPGR